MYDWIMSIPGPVWFIAALIFSAAARALPEPLQNGSRFYLFVYNFAHGLLSNYDKFKAAKNGDTQSLIPKA